MLQARVADDFDALSRYRSVWNELAVATSQPYCLPAWMLAWWRHVKPRRAVLRAIFVLDGSELIGVAPLFAQVSRTGLCRYRILGARCSSRLDLLSRPGMEEVVAAAVSARLAEMKPSPHVLFFDGIAAQSPWPRLLSTSWPKRKYPRLRTEFSQGAPRLSLNKGGYQQWYDSKGKSFRQGMRRNLRQLESLGATHALAIDHEELEDGLRDFAALHYARWNARGGSGVLNSRVERMIHEAGMELIGDLRFRLWSMELRGKTISSHIFLSAGGQVSYWLGGFDQAWGRYSPSLVTILKAIEHAFGAGGENFDLGTGEQLYKSRFADGVDQVQWVALAPQPAVLPLARLEMAPRRIRLAVARRLPPRAKQAARWALRARRAM